MKRSFENHPFSNLLRRGFLSGAWKQTSPFAE
jgi:hypothetical protein